MRSQRPKRKPINKLVILRGPSGSGKSTLAWTVCGNAQASVSSTSIHEADDYFITAKGYVFVGNKVPHAHEQCIRRTEGDMKLNTNLIVVSNTSTTLKELDPYLELANQYGYEVEIIRMKRPWDAETLAKRNKHNIPVEAIQRQIQRYQEHPNEREQE